jgi:hypothetical protein
MIADQLLRQMKKLCNMMLSLSLAGNCLLETLLQELFLEAEVRQKVFGGHAPPGPAAGAHSAPQTP